MLDATIRSRLTERFGPRAGAWLDALPARAEALAERWGVQLDPEAAPEGGRTSVVLRGRSAGDGASVVLKLAVEPALAHDEAEALEAWAGRGRSATGAGGGGASAGGAGASGTGAGGGALPPVPLLLARDDAAGALLLEAIVPGRPVSADAMAPTPGAVGRLLRELSAPAPPRALPPLRERVDVCFDLWIARRAANPVARATIGAGALERGQRLARELAGDDAAPRALVHGDLHPGNVLDGGPARGLVAIDPRACVGDPGFDAVDLTLWGAETVDAARRRIDAVSLHAGTEAERLAAWCAALAAMAAASLASRPRPATAQRIETLLALAA
jgi:streptomycin 6-kinase